MDKSIFVYHCNQHVSLFGNHYTKQERREMRVNSYTCAVDLIELDFLLSFSETLISTVKRGCTVPITIGVALCHIDDCYNRKMGAKLATERMKPVPAQITELKITGLVGNKWIMSVEFVFPEMGLVMVVRQDEQHKRPHVLFNWEVR